MSGKLGKKSPPDSRAKPKSRLVVVDASVLKYAGKSGDETASKCREYLTRILTICHRVAVTDELSAERIRHQTEFSRKWFVAMAQRGKRQTVDPRADVSINIAKFTAKAGRAIEKDLHLIHAAYAADRVIVTEDSTLMKALDKHPSGQHWLREIRWIIPSQEDVAILEEL